MHDANAAIAESSGAPPDDPVEAAAPVPHATRPARLTAATGTRTSRHRRRAGCAFVLNRRPSLGGFVSTSLSRAPWRAVWLTCAAAVGLIHQDGDMTVRWGVVGPGRIASKVVGDAPLVPNAEFVAVASRSAERAEAFAAAHGIPRAYDSYQAILDDDGVDVLYIATTHPQHRAIALAALRAGKAVLVEKAFTVTPEATREIVELATATGTFAMEAMWTRFQPVVVRLRELVADGALGEIRSVQGELCVQANPDPQDRFLNPAIGGGAVFDLSVYPISFAQMLLGDPETVHAQGTLTDTGVDLEESMLLGFPGGRSAALFCSLRCASPGQLRVFGTEGWIDVLPRFHHPDTIVLHRGDREQTVHAPRTGGGYAHELIEVTECVAAGKAQSDVMPLADTVAVQDVMAEVVRQVGVRIEEGPAQL